MPTRPKAQRSENVPDARTQEARAAGLEEEERPHRTARPHRTVRIRPTGPPAEAPPSPRHQRAADPLFLRDRRHHRRLVRRRLAVLQRDRRRARPADGTKHPGDHLLAAALGDNRPHRRRGVRTGRGEHARAARIRRRRGAKRGWGGAAPSRGAGRERRGAGADRGDRGPDRHDRPGYREAGRSAGRADRAEREAGRRDVRCRAAAPAVPQRPRAGCGRFLLQHDDGLTT